MPRVDSDTQAHLDWMGFVQPRGLVVSAPALVRAGAILNRNDAEGQQLLRDCVEEQIFRTDGEAEPYLPDFESFARSVLGWGFSPKAFSRVSDSEDAIASLVVPLVEHEEILRPDFAVRHRPPPMNGGPQWQLLVRVAEPHQGFDAPERGGGTLEATTHGRMERLLRSTGIPAGLIFNGRALRLISAPRGESSGWLDFRVADMVLTAGRPMVAAMRMLLNQSRLLTVPKESRLPALLKESRDYQNVVSERLAEQVLHALYELVRGFQAAHGMSPRGLCSRGRWNSHRTPCTAHCSPSSYAWCSCSTPSNATSSPATRRSSGTTPSPGCMTVSGKTSRSTRTRWTSATGHGRSSLSYSA